MRKHMFTAVLTAFTLLAGCASNPTMEQPGDSYAVRTGLRMVAYCKEHPKHPECAGHVKAAAAVSAIRGHERLDYKDSLNVPATFPAAVGGFKASPCLPSLRTDNTIGC